MHIASIGCMSFVGYAEGISIPIPLLYNPKRIDLFYLCKDQVIYFFLLNIAAILTVEYVNANSKKAQLNWGEHTYVDLPG